MTDTTLTAQQSAPVAATGPNLYRKTALVQAEQFLPAEGKIPAGVISDGHGDPRTDARFSFVLQTLEGVHQLRNGDYICTGPAGERWNVERSIFESTYERAAPAQVEAAPQAEPPEQAWNAAKEMAARRVEADCIGFAKEDAQLISISHHIRAMPYVAQPAQACSAQVASAEQIAKWMSLRGAVITAAINGTAIHFPPSAANDLLDVFDAALPAKNCDDDADTGAEGAQQQTQAARDVLAERRRQVEQEGWTPEHDDQYTGGQLVSAATCYANTLGAGGSSPHLWPWSESWWKPSDERRNLIKACALILAEVERQDRATHQPSAQPGAGK